MVLKQEKLIIKVGLRFRPSPLNSFVKPETKLLKTGTKYVLGRKERQLVINHKKISHDHAAFLVGSYTQDDVVRSFLRC